MTRIKRDTTEIDETFQDEGAIADDYDDDEPILKKTRVTRSSGSNTVERLKVKYEDEDSKIKRSNTESLKDEEHFEQAKDIKTEDNEPISSRSRRHDSLNANALTNDKNEEEEEDEDDEDEEDDDEQAQVENDDEDEEEKKRIMKFEYEGETYTFKERPAVLEENEGKIEFRVVNNDNTRDNMIILTGLKNIFQKQLPMMPKEYISRLVYDRTHVSIAVVRKPTMSVVGGIAYRPFESHGFAEIVFCAISSTEQVRGYGAHLMNHLKDFVLSTSKIKYFLTYADNYAIGYFKKQGFSEEITLPPSLWRGYIKDYEGATLLQCSMLTRIRYLDAMKILLMQKIAVSKKIKSISRSNIVRPGLQIFKDHPEGFSIDPMSIPGLKESGWTPEMDEIARKKDTSHHYPAMLQLLMDMQNHASSWPFRVPVSKTDVPDYYIKIEHPMDLQTMQNKFENDKYENFEDFVHDAKLICSNARIYNDKSTPYYKNANKLEKYFISRVKELPEYAKYVE